MRGYMVKECAIANFLLSMDKELGRYLNTLNALRDSELYRWDDETIEKLCKKIDEVYV
jgi:hypothetical protein